MATWKPRSIVLIELATADVLSIFGSQQSNSDRASAYSSDAGPDPQSRTAEDKSEPTTDMDRKSRQFVSKKQATELAQAYINETKAVSGLPTQIGFLKKAKAAGLGGRGRLLNALRTELGQDAPKRGRPPTKRNKSRK
jgi:hypothetical protein